MRWFVVIALASCGHAAVPPPPPPPPPPPRVENTAPPAQITDFIRAHEHDDGEWRVYFSENNEGSPRTAMLSRPAGVDLVDQLTKSTSFVTGDYGCATTPLHIEIKRGPAVLALDENCGHLRVDPQVEVMLSSQLVETIRDLRKLVLP